MTVRDVTYKCRDIGYGVERGDVFGIWGETDRIGKRELVPVDGSPVLFLFPDEVVSDDPADDADPYAIVFDSGSIQRTMDERDRDVPRVDKTTCGTCHRSWNDAIITGSTPAPSARCPFEYWHEYADDEATDSVIQVLDARMADLQAMLDAGGATEYEGITLWEAIEEACKSWDRLSPTLTSR